MTHKIGDIVYAYQGCGSPGYFIVERVENGVPLGSCFYGGDDWFYPTDGKCTNTGSCRLVPEDEVPDHVWAALAAWRMGVIV